MKKIIFLFLSIILGFGPLLAQSTSEICSALCDRRWRPDELVTTNGTDKLKQAKDDYLLFNADQTAILFEAGHTFTANWFYDDVIKMLTLNFKGIERFEEYVIYTVNKKHLVLLDIKQKKRWHYCY